MDNGNQHYHAVLHDLETRRSRCQQELADIEQTISGIRKLLAKDASLFTQIPQQMPQPVGKYSGMSVRWAVLAYLAEEATEPVPTSVIAQALLEGGMTTRGRDFNSNVSAVISVMIRDRGEAENVGNGYRITDNGRAAWAAIQNTPQYRARPMVSSNM
ncbi:MAG: hypothetical protein WA294_21815 [Acidobacteriaceae bacterium]